MRPLSKPRTSDVAVQRYVYRSADDDGNKPTILALAHPERPGLRLRVADAGDDALVDRRIADAVDDDVVALILQRSDRLLCVAGLDGLRHCGPAGANTTLSRRYCCCHTPACAHDSLHSFVCLVFVHRPADTRCCRAFLSNLCGINGRAAVCLARIAVSMRGGVRTFALLRAVDGDDRFRRFRESGPDRTCTHGTPERLRGDRPARQGSPRRVLGLGSRLDRRPAAVWCAGRSCRRRGDDTGVVGFGCRLGSSTRWSPARRRRSIRH